MAIEALLNLAKTSKTHAAEAKEQGESTAFYEGAALAYTLAAEQVTFYLSHFNNIHANTGLAQ